MKVSFWLAALLIAATVPVKGAAGQDLPVSPPAQIAAGARACLNAITREGLDARRLASDGWIGRNAGQGDAATWSGSRTFRRDSVVLLELPTFRNCIVVARIAGEADFLAVVTVLAQTMGVPEIDEDGMARWTLADGKFVLAEVTGSPDQPGIAITVRAGGSLE